MSRQRKSVRSQEIKLSLPQDLSARVDILLWDAALQKPKYGARSELITMLLTKWCDEQETGDADVDIADETERTLHV